MGRSVEIFSGYKERIIILLPDPYPSTPWSKPKYLNKPSLALLEPGIFSNQDRIEDRLPPESNPVACFKWPEIETPEFPRPPPPKKKRKKEKKIEPSELRFGGLLYKN